MPQGDPPIPLNAEQRRVAAMLLNLARRCREAILNPTGKTDAQRSWNTSQAAARLRAIEQDLLQFNRSLARTVPAAMQSHFDRGLHDANKQLREAEVLAEGEPIRGSFAQVDSSRAQALVRDTADDLAKAGKTTIDQTRRTVRDIHALGLDGKEIRTIIAGGTIDGQPKSALAAIRKRAQAVADKDGRLWVVNRNGEAMSFDPRSYADMVFQTGSAEAANIATLERLDSKGIKYVKIIGSNSANFCTAFVDKVYYTGPGDDPQGLYPHIRELPDGGPPFHPRCTKRYAAFVVGLKTPAEIEAGKPDAATQDLHGQSRNEAQKRYAAGARKASATPPSPTASPTVTPPSAQVLLPANSPQPPDLYPPALQGEAARWASTLTDQEMADIARWQSVGEGYQRINRALRAKESNDAWAVEAVAGIRSAISKGSIPEQMSVFRVLRNEDILDRLRAHFRAGVPWPSQHFFASSAVEEGTASFRPKRPTTPSAILEVQVAEGTPAAFPPMVTGRLVEQAEILFGDNSRIEIISVDESENPVRVKARMLR